MNFKRSKRTHFVSTMNSSNITYSYFYKPGISSFHVRTRFAGELLSTEGTRIPLTTTHGQRNIVSKLLPRHKGAPFAILYSTEYAIQIPSPKRQIIRPLTPEVVGPSSRAPRYDQPAKWPASHERTGAVRRTYSATRTRASS